MLYIVFVLLLYYTLNICKYELNFDSFSLSLSFFLSLYKTKIENLQTTTYIYCNL